jgi:hypothetical protein
MSPVSIFLKGGPVPKGAATRFYELSLNRLRLEVFTAVTMKNAVFWDMKPSSYFTGNTLPLRYRAQPVNAM